MNIPRYSVSLFCCRSFFYTLPHWKNSTFTLPLMKNSAMIALSMAVLRGQQRGDPSWELRSLTAYFFWKNWTDNSVLFQTFARSAQIGKTRFHDPGGVEFFEERAERAVAFISKYVLPLLAVYFRHTINRTANKGPNRFRCVTTNKLSLALPRYFEQTLYYGYRRERC